MAGINHLRNIYKKQGDEFLNQLLNGYLIVKEKTNGSLFGFRKDQKTDKFKFFKKRNELTYIDRVLSRYYNDAIDYVNGLDDKIVQRIPSNLYFGMEYIPSTDINVEDYSRMPKNNLILSFIHVYDESGNIKHTIQEKSKLDEWASVLGIEGPTIVFEGKLNDEQKEEILDFVHSPIDRLVDRFKTESFVKHIVNTLDPEIENTFMEGSSLRDMNGLVFRFYEMKGNEIVEGKPFLAKMIDPIFEKKIKDNSDKIQSEPEDYTWLIVIDLMNYIERYSPMDIKKWNIKGDSYEERYIKFVNKVFIDFMSHIGSKYDGLELNKPKYLESPEFDLNIEEIKDIDVIDLIDENETNKEIYKILVNFFRRKRKGSPSPFFDEGMVEQLNLLVTKIKKMLFQESIFESRFPTFNEFIGESGEYEMVDIDYFSKHKRGIEKPIKVNLLIGNFQPVHMGHIKAVEKLNKKNGLPVVLVALSKGAPSEAFPFSEDTQRVMLNKVEQEYKGIIKDVIIIKNGSIDDVISSIKAKYIPILWGTSAKRSKHYGLQLNYLKRRNVSIELNKDFKLIELPDFMSGGEVIQCLKDEDYAKFKEIVPKSISPEFFNLKREIDNIDRLTESLDVNVQEEKTETDEEKQD